jgi:hypothetical protein
LENYPKIGKLNKEKVIDNRSEKQIEKDRLRYEKEIKEKNALDKKREQALANHQARTTWSKNSFRRKPVVWRDYKMPKGMNKTAHEKLVAISENLSRR